MSAESYSPSPTPNPSPEPPPSTFPKVVQKPPATAGEPITRRRFLVRCGWGLFSIFLGGLGASFLRYLFPNVLYEPSMTFKAGDPNEYEVGNVSDKWKKAQRVWIIRTPDGIYAMWARCTHLGCTPNWFTAENRFKCPCHGSNFSMAGDVIAGPAPKPLWRCAVSLSPGGQLVVDKNQLQNKPGKREQAPFFLPLKAKT